MAPGGAPCSTACTPAGSQDTSSPGPSSQAPSIQPHKSAKRRAAEALLQRRYSSPALAGASDSDAAAPAKRQKAEPARPAVHVPACSDCSCDSASCKGQVAQAAGWCAQDVSLPPMDWPAVLCTPVRDGDLQRDADAVCYQLPGGVQAHVVSRAAQLPGALAALRDSMADSIVGIDLEWRPEGWTGAGPSRVALMQLASASVAVLVRVCRIGHRMPPALRAFLSDPELTIVGFSWDSADEGKMQQTFGEGRAALFPRFFDLQQVASSLGYHGLGLGALTRRVLGLSPPKNKKVTMSNWEARRLSDGQVRYAALDALVTAHVYRGLRLWHASPSACTACRQMLGEVLPAPVWRCYDCPRTFSSPSAANSHRLQKQHRCGPDVCEGCGRVQPAAADGAREGRLQKSTVMLRS